jgi:hypothetical protein
MAIHDFEIRLKTQVGDFVRKMDKAGKSVGSTFLQMTNPSLSQRAALAVQGHRGQIKKLKTAYDATGRSDKKLRAQLEKTVHSMRKARSGARAYGKSLAVAAGNSKKLTSASVINNGAWGPLGSAIGGRLVGGAAIVQSAALVVKNVIDAKTREDQALFRIGTVSGYDPGTDDRKAFQQGSLAKARAVADFRGFKIYELLDNQYALLYAGLEQSLALKGAETVAIVAKNTNSNPDAKLSGRCLFLDLDTVIVDNMDDFFSYPRRFYIIRNWIERRKQIFRARPQVGNSSVFRFETGTNSHVANLFLQNPAHANNRLIFPTEQAFITHAIEKNNITWRPESWVRSFKRHCLPIFPLNWLRRPQMEAGTKIIAFHGGTPKLDKVIKGTVGNWYKRTLPMPQLAKHWK